MEKEEDADGSIVSVRLADAVVALILIGIGVVVMTDSLRLGAGWSNGGPESGYFPFYIGLLIVLASTGTLVHTLIRRSAVPAAFVGREQFRHVLKVLVPTVIFVASIGFIGIYAATMVFIAIFMRWLGHFRWTVIAAVSVAVPIVFFLLFEMWFLVPLPKGPVEDFLGF